MQKLLSCAPFGANLKKLREEAGYTQEALVAQMQLLGSPISRTAYAMIEAGTRNVFMSDLVALQQIFSVSFDAFFADIPTER